MTATYIFDVLATLDGFGSYNGSGDWGGYWGKQGPDSRRPAQYSRGAAAGSRATFRSRYHGGSAGGDRCGSVAGHPARGSGAWRSDALRSRPSCLRPTDTRSTP